MAIKGKLGQTLFVAFMLGVVCFILGLALGKPMTDVVTDSMTQLDCSNSTITDQTKAVCTSLDLFVPLMTGLIFGLAGLLIGGLAVR